MSWIVVRCFDEPVEWKIWGGPYGDREQALVALAYSRRAIGSGADFRIARVELECEVAPVGMELKPRSEGESRLAALEARVVGVESRLGAFEVREAQTGLGVMSLLRRTAHLDTLESRLATQGEVIKQHGARLDKIEGQSRC